MGFRHWLFHNSKWEKSLSPLWDWMVLFVCLWILVPLKNFSLILRRHLYLWRTANFNLCSALMAIEQWGFFSMPHLTWHGASMYNGPVTFTPIAEPLAVKLSLLRPFIWTNLNPLHPRMHCAKFGWNWPSGSGEEDLLISSMYFCNFIFISPWKRAGAFIWTNLNPLHLRMFCAKFDWNWPSGSGEEDENVKCLQTDRQIDGQTDDGKKVIRKAHLSFQLRWAKNLKSSQQRLRRQQQWRSADKLLSGKLSWAFGSGEIIM